MRTLVRDGLLGWLALTALAASTLAQQEPKVAAPKPAVAEPPGLLPDGSASLNPGGAKLELVPQTGHLSLVWAVAFSPDGRHVLTGSWDKTAILWDTRTGLQVRTFRGHRDFIEAVAFSPDGRRVVTGSKDNTAILWDAASGQVLQTLRGRVNHFHALAFGPGGKTILAGSHGVALVWDARSGELVRQQNLHHGIVQAMAFSADGRRVATGATDKSVRVWDAETGRPLHTLTGHQRDVKGVAFSPDGRQLLSCADDATARLWDLETGRALHTFTGPVGPAGDVRTGRRVPGDPTPFLLAAFRPDGRELLTVSFDRLTVRDPQTGRSLRTLKGEVHWVNTAAYSPDGQTLLVAFQSSAALLDAATGRRLRTFVGHMSAVEAVAFSPDGQQARLGTSKPPLPSPDGPPGLVEMGKLAVVWDGQLGRQQSARPDPGGQAVARSTTATSPDGKQVSPVHFDGRFSVPEVLTALAPDGAATRRPASPHVPPLLTRPPAPNDHKSADGAPPVFRGHAKVASAVAYRPDGKEVLTGSPDGTVIAWDVRTGRQLRTLGPVRGITALAYRPDGRRALAGTEGPESVEWDLETGAQTRSFPGHQFRVSAVAYSPDGKRALTGGWDNTAVVWDAETGQRLRALGGKGVQVSAVAFSPDGRHALTAAWEPKVATWDVETGRLLRTFEGLDKTVLAAAYSPDGKWVVAGGQEKVAVVWDAATGERRLTLAGHDGPVSTVLFRPDGGQILTGSQGVLHVWDAETGRPLRRLTGEGIIWTPAAYSPDGRLVLHGPTLRDAQTGDAVRTFRGRPERVLSLAFSPDGQRLLMGGQDRLAVAWDTKTGQQQLTLEGHSDWVTALAYSPDGKRVLTGSNDGTARLWDAATGEELVRLITLDGGRDWAVVTPQGLFDGSPGGRREVAFRVGGLDVVPLDRFFQDSYYPGLLAAVWAGERPRPGQPLRPSRAPLVRMLAQPPGPGSDAKDRLVVDVAVTDQGEGVRGPTLRHNSTAVRSASQVRRDGPTVHHRFTLSLVRGENRIEAQAATADGARESDPALLLYQHDGTPAEPELYVLAVGINRYAAGAGVGNLDYCVPDARALADLLKRRAQPLYHRVHVTELLDEQATRSQLLKAVAAVADKARPQDTLAVYVGSHGITLGQRFYLIPHEVRLDATTPEEREDQVRRQGLAIDDLGDELSRVPALRRVLIFDTCHSGNVLNLARRDRNPFAFQGAIARFGRAQGVYVLAATSGHELAAENKDLGHSFLTYALLAGLGEIKAGPLAGKGAAAGHTVDVLDWFRFAQQHVPSLYERYVGRAQTIELSGDDQPGFPLVKPDSP